MSSLSQRRFASFLVKTMQASKRDIVKGLNAIKAKAKKCFRAGDTQITIDLVDAYFSIAGQFNFNYVDNEIEALLKRISESVILQSNNYEPNREKWILYDDFCTTYVLGLQWLDALAATGKRILYITSRDIYSESRHKNILDRVSAYSNVETLIIPQGGSIERAQSLYDGIVRFGASKIILHKYATASVMDLVLPILPSGMEKYVINLSDQTFWFGARFIDYCLEFRKFGASVSMQRRGLTKEQLLMVPFYPADDQNPFTGFPAECTRDKVVIFSGGDYYKTLDEERTYWRLVKELLDRYPQVVFLFATKNIPEGDSEIKHFIADNHFEGRFIYIQFRPDIYQVFAHCDIYMGTCPTSGSLMSQLAAVNSKPILQFYKPGTSDDETEQALCINEKFLISYNDEEAFFNEADKLIHDAEYRRIKGRRLQSAMMHREQFNRLVLMTLSSNKTQFPIEEYDINYRELDNRWYYLEKAGYIHTIPYLYSLLGAKDCLLFAASIFIKKNMARFFPNC